MHPFGSSRGKKADKFHLPSFEEKKNPLLRCSGFIKGKNLINDHIQKTFLRNLKNLEILTEAVNY